MSYRVRPAKLSDAPELARLTLELGYTHSLPEIESRLHALLLRPDPFIAVAVGDPIPLLGWIAAERRLILESGDIVEIVGLVVDTTQQRAGIGRALVTATEQWATIEGVSTLWVRSNVARTASHPFYETLGYVRIKTQHAYVKARGFD
ncbi:MAG: GNAT family N-acetyltransferase [Sulfuriferula multivorans]|uniref:GNAT family N-acetyltransferase n=1 Tax=Sulfuriferula multivorans TaxID=1559896 RepID=A0A7C9P710_9PROT|nr:GNAT family N-acetyltransferase [Sulfuriferula multivorans]